MKLERIRNLREDNDYKQVQLANYLHVKQSTYSDYENGNINVPIEALIKLADYYNTSLDYLVERTDIKTPYQRKKQSPPAGGS